MFIILAVVLLVIWIIAFLFLHVTSFLIHPAHHLRRHLFHCALRNRQASRLGNL